MSYAQSIFTEATRKVMEDREELKKVASKAQAPTFMHETGVPAKARRKKFADMTEFERIMEIQLQGQDNILKSEGGNGRII